MRPKCERGWHWSGRAYLCEPCFQDWQRQHNETLRRWRITFGLDPDTGKPDTFPNIADRWRTENRKHALRTTPNNNRT